MVTPAAFRVSLGLAALVGAVGCLRPSEERARRDELVGIAEADGVRIEVAGGQAVVRELARERVLLWASAPRL
jgi:hypothetical protein